MEEGDRGRIVVLQDMAAADHHAISSPLVPSPRPDSDTVAAPAGQDAWGPISQEWDV
jgi:hypothetical protein